MTRIARILGLAVLLTQLTGVSQGVDGPPYLRGSLATELMAGDTDQIVRLCAGVGGRAWVIEAYPLGPAGPTWVADVYLIPDRVTTRLRRGRTLTCLSKLPQSPRDQRKWRLDEEHGAYAQVALAEKTFGSTLVEPARLQEQPFLVAGQWSDDEILSVVDFIRSCPIHFSLRPGPGQALPSGRIEGWGPIAALSREWDLFQVSIKRGEGTGQFVQLHREGAKWVVIDVSDWIV